jgi:hypothetical protein
VQRARRGCRCACNAVESCSWRAMGACSGDDGAGRGDGGRRCGHGWGTTSAGRRDSCLLGLIGIPEGVCNGRPASGEAVPNRHLRAAETVWVGDGCPRRFTQLPARRAATRFACLLFARRAGEL